MRSIVLEILSLIKSFIGLKVKKIEKEIKIQEKKEKEALSTNERINKNNEYIREGKVDDIAIKMKEYNDMLEKQKLEEFNTGKKKK